MTMPQAEFDGGGFAREAYREVPTCLVIKICKKYFTKQLIMNDRLQNVKILKLPMSSNKHEYIHYLDI